MVVNFLSFFKIWNTTASISFLKDAFIGCSTFSTSELVLPLSLAAIVHDERSYVSLFLLFCIYLSSIQQLTYNTYKLKVCVCSVTVSDSLWPMDCSLPGSCVHGILLVRIPQCSPLPSWPWTQTHIFGISCIADRFFAH